MEGQQGYENMDRRSGFIRENISKIRQEIPADVCMVAVSKTMPWQDLQAAYDSGQRVFGENKVQEIEAKRTKLPKDIEWHMIGHLQSNKVKIIAPYVALIHGVDSVSLLQEIDKQGRRCGRQIDCLLQVHIAQEESKFGFDCEEVPGICREINENKDRGYTIRGLMGMATFTDDERRIRSEFRKLKTLFDEVRRSELFPADQFSILSMGMSGDYIIAIEEGSTMVRIGSSIFGSRTDLP
jgi:pyridoxal phosphate enzyme (YggS family)